MLGEVRPGYVMLVQVRLCYNMLGHFSSSYFRLGLFRPGEIRLGQVISCYDKLN
jgi:hypothetical protein